MSAPLSANRKLCLRYFYRLLQTNIAQIKTYSVSKKTIKEVLRNDIKNEHNSLSTEGWVKSMKRQKRNTFFHINDGSSNESLQVIANPDICSSSIGYGCSVHVEGELVESPARGQNVELKASNVRLIGPCSTEEYPIQFKQKQKLSYLRTIPHLRPRTEHNSRMLQVRNTATMAVHNFFQGNDFMFVHTPIITSSNCEGAVEMFSLQTNCDVDMDSTSREDESSGTDIETDTEDGKHSDLFFNRPTYLTVSGQLHLEVMTGCTRKVYNFGPTFRAEPSLTSHHLAEFYMIEAELAFTEDLESICQVMENLVKDITRDIMAKHSDDLDYFRKQASNNYEVILSNLMEKKYIRITYTDAVKLLQKESKNCQTLQWGDDLSKEQEKSLVTILGNIPVFVTDFPQRMKPFYCRQNADDQTVAAVDLLVPGVGELFGGSLREERFDVLKDRLDQLNLSSDYNWYLDLRRYGSVPHGGFGMGFERYLQCLLGIQNIKDTIPFPRWPKRCLL